MYFIHVQVLDAWKVLVERHIDHNKFFFMLKAWYCEYT